MASKVSLTRPVRRESPVLTSSTRTDSRGDPFPLKGKGGAPAVDDVSDVVEKFKKLSTTDRRKALALMSLEQQSSVSAADGRDIELWSEAVHEALRGAIGASDGPAHGVQVVRRVMGLPANWAPVADFMRGSNLDQLESAERYSAYLLLAQLVVDRARDTARAVGMPLTLKLVGSTSLNCAGLFDGAFPGYVAGGYAAVVVRGLAAAR